MKLRTIGKIMPAQKTYRDQQFWPALVALTVLSAIALGFVSSNLQGPWMWGSLLGLSLVAAAIIFLLFNLDNKRLRRSLRFVIIASLPVQLLILVFASIANLFHVPHVSGEQQLADHRIGKIEISDQQAPLVSEEATARKTPEPKPETEQQTAPAAPTQPEQDDTTPALMPGKIELEKPDLSFVDSKPRQQTVVKKPVIKPPESTKETVIDLIKKETRNSAVPLGAVGQPDISRTVKPSIPTLTNPTIPPASKIQSKDSALETAETIPELKPSFLPSNFDTLARKPTAPDTALTKPLASEATKRETRKPDLLVDLKPSSEIARTVQPTAPTLTTPNLAKSDIPQPSLQPQLEPPAKPGTPESVAAKPTQTQTKKQDAIPANQPKAESPQFGSVSGRITLDGQILKGAKIEFIPVDEPGAKVTVKTNRLGRFTIVAGQARNRPGIKTGDYKVSITTFLESPDENIIDFLEEVPAKYNSETTLTTTIDGDQPNKLNFDLKTK